MELAAKEELAEATAKLDDAAEEARRIEKQLLDEQFYKEIE